MERLASWLVTGPIGRFAAFVLDFAAALIDAARRRITRV
jgi:hypothetical protein